MPPVFSLSGANSKTSCSGLSPASQWFVWE